MTENQTNTTQTKEPILKRLAKFVRRHKKATIALVALLVVAVLIISLTNSMRAAAGTHVAPPQTIALARMDLEQIVSGTGPLQSSVTRDVNSNLSYNIAEIYVEEGDTVQEGQLLALVDSADLDTLIAQTREKISDAVASDRLALEQAQRRLTDANNQRTIDDDEFAIQEQDALSALNVANAELDSARAARDQALAAWQAAQGSVNSYPPVGDPAFVQPDYDALVQVQATAETTYTDAEQLYQTKLTAAQAAQAAYDSVVQNRANRWRTNSISIENAQDQVNTLKLNDSAASYRIQLDDYLDDKADCEIKAPIAGTITVVNAQVGSSAGGSLSAAGTGTGSSALFTIEDPKKLEVTLTVAEYDVPLVAPGMSAVITSDALDGQEWNGTVQSISPKATDDNANFTVLIKVTSPTGELAIGMSTKVNIIISSRPNVFAVPYDALSTNEAGEDIVYVWDEAAQSASSGNAPPESPASMPDTSGQAALVPAGAQAVVVQVGMETDYYVEISSPALEEGMTLLADPNGNNVSSNDSIQGGFMIGGGGV